MLLMMPLERHKRNNLLKGILVVGALFTNVPKLVGNIVIGGFLESGCEHVAIGKIATTVLFHFLGSGHVQGSSSTLFNIFASPKEHCAIHVCQYSVSTEFRCDKSRVHRVGTNGYTRCLEFLVQGTSKQQILMITITIDIKRTANLDCPYASAPVPYVRLSQSISSNEILPYSWANDDKTTILPALDFFITSNNCIVSAK